MRLVGLHFAVQSNVRINFNAMKKTNEKAQKSYVYQGGLPFLSSVSLLDVNSLFYLISTSVHFRSRWSHYVRMCRHYFNDKEVTNGL